MKTSPSYKIKIPVAELLDHPNAWLVRDVLSQTGTAVLIPGRIPIRKLIESLGNPNRIVDSLMRLGFSKIDIEEPQDLDVDDIMQQLSEADPTVKIVSAEVTKQAEQLMGDIYANLSLSEKYNIPREEVEELGRTLANEIAATSQIALSLAMSDRDSYSQNHALNVSLLSGYIAKKLVEAGKAPGILIDKAILAGLLFDIGKTAIPGEILSKKETLSKGEITVLHKHTEESVFLCKQAGIADKDILDGIAAHHERYDGSGYPKGLVGNRIPLTGRILGLADTFDAMTSPRVYKDAVSSKLAFNFIMSANETEFDPDICGVFMAGMGIYPPGDAVLLSDGRVGTVAGTTEGNLLQPRVAVKESGVAKILNLAEEKLFITRSLNVEPRETPSLLETLL